MTYEEALNQGIKMTDEYARNDLERYLLRKEEPIPKSVALGMKALEKQIPKTPKETEKGSFLELDNGTQYEILGLCPNCSVPFIGCVPKYCSACGQAIELNGEN